MINSAPLTKLKYFVRKVRSNSLSATLMRGAGGAFLVRIIGGIFALCAQILLARVMGAEQYGIYAYVVSWLIILVLPSKLGLDTMILRFVAAYRAREEWGLLHGVIRSGTKLVLLSSLAVGGILFLTVWLLGERISPELRLTFWISCTVLPVMALVQVQQAVLRSLQWVVRAVLPPLLLQPFLLAITVAILVFVLGVRVSSKAAMAVHLATFCSALLLSSYWARQALAGMAQPAAMHIRLRKWFGVALPLAMMSGFGVINQRVDVIMIGAMLGTTPAGIYTAAARWAGLLSWGLVAVNMIIAPLISHLYAQGKIEDLQRLISHVAAGVAAFTIPAGLLLVVVGKQLLLLFGDSFVVGYNPLILLALGQCANALAGSVGYLLTMTGHQRDAAWAMGIVAGVNIMLNALLIPHWGLEGAASATAISMLLWNLAMYFLVKKRLNIDSTIAGLVRLKR